MKSHPVLAGLAIATSVMALAVGQVSESAVGVIPDPMQTSDDDRSAAGNSYSEKELDELLAPLALYPDPLIALILPASTSPSDIVLASRHLAAQPKSNSFDDQPWEDAVRSLARYPEVIKWMDENLAWTKRLGEAFLRQPVDVMNAVQRLRARAKASGALASNKQQAVVEEAGVIRIVPAQPEIIYVPRYDPFSVYMGTSFGWPGPFISFGIGFPLGYWAAYDCDWQHRRVYVVGREYRVRVWNACRTARIPLYHYRTDHRYASHWNVWHAGLIPHASSARRYTHVEGGTARTYSSYRSNASAPVTHSGSASISGAPGGYSMRRNPDPNTGRNQQPGHSHSRVAIERQENQPLPQGGIERSQRRAQIPQPGHPDFMGPIVSSDRQRVQSSAGVRRIDVPAHAQPVRPVTSERYTPQPRPESPPSYQRNSSPQPAQGRGNAARFEQMQRSTTQHAD